MPVSIKKSASAKTAQVSFADSVYAVVAGIPRGATLTYKEVAARAGRPQAHRAVGNILNKNYDLAIPCHRVVRSDGTSGGYNRGPEQKKNILEQERRGVIGGYAGKNPLQRGGKHGTISA